MPPPIFAKYTRQGGHVVARNTDGSITRNPETGAQVRAVLPPRAGKETVRRALHRLTNGGEDLVLRMLNLSAGVPIEVPPTSDGRKTDPIVPTAEVMLQATKDLLDRGWGKAVAQTEVLKAELEAEDAMQYAAMSNEALLEAVERGKKQGVFLERVEKPKEDLPEGDVTVTVEE